jgi:hypothetical protein
MVGVWWDGIGAGAARSRTMAWAYRATGTAGGVRDAGNARPLVFEACRVG